MYLAKLATAPSQFGRRVPGPRQTHTEGQMTVAVSGMVREREAVDRTDLPTGAGATAEEQGG